MYLRCRQRKTEPRPHVKRVRKIWRNLDMRFRDMQADRQTNRQTVKETDT